MRKCAGGSGLVQRDINMGLFQTNWNQGQGGGPSNGSALPAVLSSQCLGVADTEWDASCCCFRHFGNYLNGGMWLIWSSSLNTGPQHNSHFTWLQLILMSVGFYCLSTIGKDKLLGFKTWWHLMFFASIQPDVLQTWRSVGSPIGNFWWATHPGNLLKEKQLTHI